MRGAREPAVSVFRTPVGLQSTACIPTRLASAPVRSDSAASSQERSGIEDPICGAGDPRSNGCARHRWVWFAWHKVKQAAANNGIDLNSFSETHRGPARQFDACELLTKEDLSQILNLNVERAEGDGLSTHSTCRYFSSGAQQRSLEEAPQPRRNSKRRRKPGTPKPISPW